MLVKNTVVGANASHNHPLVSGNGIGAEAVQALATDALPALTALTSLNMSGAWLQGLNMGRCTGLTPHTHGGKADNNAGPDATKALAQLALPKLTQLEELILSSEFRQMWSCVPTLVRVWSQQMPLSQQTMPVRRR